MPEHNHSLRVHAYRYNNRFPEETDYPGHSIHKYLYTNIGLRGKLYFSLHEYRLATLSQIGCKGNKSF